VLPFAPRADQPASRVLVRGIKGSRAPLSLLSARALHGDEGNGFSPEIEAVLQGAAPLRW
jgi:tRNA1(Val) A37 N6-methylase TrmN6